MKRLLLSLLILIIAAPCIAGQSMRRHIEPETLAYDALPNAMQDQLGTNELIKSVKYGNGVTLSGLTCNLSLVNGTAFITNPSVDLRKYVGFKTTITETTHSLVGWIKAAGTGEKTSGVYTSDFSAGENGWTGSRGTVAGDIDSIGGEDNWLRLTIDTQNDVHYANKYSIFTIGKQYTVSFRYYIPSGQTVLAGVQFAGVTYQSTLGAATTVTYTWTATVTNLRVYATSSDSSTFIQDAGGDDVFYIKDIQISEYLTPSSTGVTIVSTKGGSTYNWTSDSGILPNAASFTAIITKE